MAHFFLASEALGLVAVYSPKCASQTIRGWCQTAIEEASGELVENLDGFLVGPGGTDRCGNLWKVFFVRDPLRRLVSFYAQWVVAQQEWWCFADEQRRISLRGKTFRQFLFAMQHLHEHGIAPQHHLVPQLANTEGWSFDEVVPVERLQEGLDALSRRVGIAAPVTSFNQRHYGTIHGESVADRDPDWLRSHGFPRAGWFYDRDAHALASEIYSRDIEYYRKYTGLDVAEPAG